MERTQPEARLYDAVVASDGSGDYTTLQGAIDAAPEGRAKPWLIFVKNGQYKEHIDIPAKKPYLHIIGQDRDKAVILDDKLCGGDNAVHVSVGATVVVNASNIFFENITLENSYGHEKQAGPQALALNTQGDRIALNNVALLSYQDTWITTSTQKNRHYIKNSLIEGAVDFIYNGGDVYLDGDTIEINRPSGGYIVAPWHTAETQWGYVFQNNIIRAHKGVDVTDVWLGRPWHGSPKTVYINTQTFVNIPAKGWYNTMGGLPELWAEYNTVDANGNPLDLSQRESYYYYWADAEKTQKVEKFDVKNTLTAEEAAQYTLKNVMSGNDGWQPDLLCEACDAPQVKGEGSTLSWQAVPYAICYVVTKNGEVAGFTKETSFDGYTEGDLWQVQAVNEFGGLSQKATANATTAIDSKPTAISQQPSAYYTLDGRLVSQLQHGLNIVRMSDGTVRKVMVK
jgi:pectin methylesterase-like acyl-CoA thioesterase